MENNQLAVIVKQSGLEPAKAKAILTQFQDYFDIAADWETKAKSIKVTNENQVTEMEMARTGRLFLKDKRVAVEKSRKELKEQALREGKAIDGIANVLKALIVPIEEYLEKQEKFVEIREAQKQEVRRLEIEARMAKEEEERIAKEQAEHERMRIENEKLRKEAEVREKKMAAERKNQEAILAKERAKSEAEKRFIEEKARLEREKQEKTLANEKAKAKILKELAEEKAEVKLEAERKEKERLAEILKNTIKCPKCGHQFSIKKG